MRPIGAGGIVTPNSQPFAGDILAAAIPVKRFREILIWPLALDLLEVTADANAVRGAMCAAVDRITAAGRSGQTKWLPVDDPSEHILQSDSEGTELWRARRYAEGVYFHDFVQRFLFSPHGPRPVGEDALDQAPFRLFRRTDIRAVQVTLGGKAAAPRKLRFVVDRVNLYLFRTGAAVVVIEVAFDPKSNGMDLDLKDVQNFHEQFRRAYIPYALETGEPSDLVVRRVTWELEPAAEKSFEIDKATMTEMVQQYLDVTATNGAFDGDRRSPPLFGHWRFLLDCALPLTADRKERRPGEGTWHHVVDERMPSIAAVSVTAPGAGDEALTLFKRTHRGELIRLCFADRAGETSLPYYPQSLTDFELEHAYEAFRDQGTLFLASGYAFVAYGAGNFFDTIVEPVHMRRHYFQIALLAHLELASLLSFSSRISRAVRTYNPMQETPDRFEAVMHAIEDEYLQFIHLFRFTGAANHVQAQELTALWRRHLRLPELAADLHAEITSATQYLFNRAASRGAATAERLSAIGLFGVVAGLSFGALGMNFLAAPAMIPRWIRTLRGLPGSLAPFTSQPDPSTLSLPGQACVVFLVLASFTTLGRFGLSWLRSISGGEFPPRGRSPRAMTFEGQVIGKLGLAAAAFWLLAILFFVLWRWRTGGAFE